MNALRKVIVSKDVGSRDAKTGRLKYVAEPIGEAMFHGFSVDSYQADGGVMTYCVAVVEFPDGKVDTVYPTLIQFVNPPARSRRRSTDERAERYAED